MKKWKVIDSSSAGEALEEKLNFLTRGGWNIHTIVPQDTGMFETCAIVAWKEQDVVEQCIEGINKRMEKLELCE